MQIRSLLFGLLLPGVLCAQVDLTFNSSVPVHASGSPLALPWGGGLNCPVVSDIDLDGDGDKDLFFLDRAGNKAVMFLNTGGPGQTRYALTHAYDGTFPFPLLHDWALFRDYNCDGKEDLFAYTNGAFAVYKNTSTGSSLSFTLVDDEVGSNYVPTLSPNLFISSSDLPGIEDVDGDGDLDVLTFSIFGSYIEYHKNLSMELYGTCDSLTYEVRSRCWGAFYENGNNNSVHLDAPCNGNVPHPELPIEIAHATAELARNHGVSDERAHIGSTVLPLDLDGDADMDLILGDLSVPTLVAIMNGGAIDSAYMTQQDSLFPIYDESAMVNVFPAAYYEDVNNDGKRDLLVTPSYPTLSENKHGIWQYNNIGTDAAPVFSFVTDDLIQGDMLDFGEGAYPVLFDHNSDGLMDLVVSNYGYYVDGQVFSGRMALLENTGTTTAPAFTLITDNYMGLDAQGVGNCMYPAFGDMDGDGDEDMYIGDALGRVHYFRNNSTGPIAQFALFQPTVESDLDTLIDVGQQATPQFYDLDEDGLLDLLIGERNGNLNYYHNTGTSTSPIWHLENDSIGGVVVSQSGYVTGYSVPFMHKDASGANELLVGSESGWIYQYDGIDGNLNGTWNLVDNTWQGLREGSRTALVMYDFDGDGKKDAIIGNYRGGLSYWRNDFSSGIATWQGGFGTDAFSLAPNPATTGVDITLNMPLPQGLRLELLNDLGQVVHASIMRSKRSHLDTERYHNGVYLVRLTNGEARWTQRLVVLH